MTKFSARGDQSTSEEYTVRNKFSICAHIKTSITNLELPISMCSKVRDFGCWDTRLLYFVDQVILYRIATTFPSKIKIHLTWKYYSHVDMYKKQVWWPHWRVQWMQMRIENQTSLCKAVYKVTLTCLHYCARMRAVFKDEERCALKCKGVHVIMLTFA